MGVVDWLSARACSGGLSKAFALYCVSPASTPVFEEDCVVAYLELRIYNITVCGASARSQFPGCGLRHIT